MKLLTVLYTVSILLVSQHVAATTGVIRFIGAITEPSCITNVSGSQVKMQCIRTGVAESRTIGKNAARTLSPYNLAYVSVTNHNNIRSMVVEYK